MTKEEGIAFAEWVADTIFDDNWEYNKEAFAEIACRKLSKLGIVARMGDEWVLVDNEETLEQEPCEDAISRQAAIDGLNSINGTSELDKAFEVIENLPPVNPRPKAEVLDKIRAWINSPNRGTCDYFIVDRIEEIIDKYKVESEE